MNDLIREARELCEGATPGPWQYETCGYSGKIEIRFGNIDYVLGCASFLYDAEFIAKSRDLIPALCTALEQAEKERDAAIEDISPSCFTCKKRNTNTCPGSKCNFQMYDYWQWRGVQEVDNGL